MTLRVRVWFFFFLWFDQFRRVASFFVVGCGEGHAIPWFLHRILFFPITDHLSPFGPMVPIQKFVGLQPLFFCFFPITLLVPPPHPSPPLPQQILDLCLSTIISSISREDKNNIGKSLNKKVRVVIYLTLSHSENCVERGKSPREAKYSKPMNVFNIYHRSSACGSTRSRSRERDWEFVDQSRPKQQSCFIFKSESAGSLFSVSIHRWARIFMTHSKHFYFVATPFFWHIQSVVSFYFSFFLSGKGSVRKGGAAEKKKRRHL